MTKSQSEVTLSSETMSCGTVSQATRVTIPSRLGRKTVVSKKKTTFLLLQLCFLASAFISFTGVVVSLYFLHHITEHENSDVDFDVEIFFDAPRESLGQLLREHPLRLRPLSGWNRYEMLEYILSRLPERARKRTMDAASRVYLRVPEDTTKEKVDELFSRHAGSSEEELLKVFFRFSDVEPRVIEQEQDDDLAGENLAIRGVADLARCVYSLPPSMHFCGNWILRLTSYYKLVTGNKTVGERAAATYLLYDSIRGDDAKQHLVIANVLQMLFDVLTNAPVAREYASQIAGFASAVASDFLEPMSGMRSFLNVADEANDKAESIKDHAILREVQKILTVLVVHLSVDKSISKKLQTCGLIKRVDTSDWVSGESVFDVALNLSRSVVKLLRHVSGIESACDRVDSVELLCDAVDWLAKYEHRRSQNPLPGEVLDQVWVDKLLLCTRDRHRVRPDRATSYLYNMAVKTLDSMYLAQMSKDHATRGAPFVYALLGAPGTGKTDIVGRLWQKQALHGLGYTTERKDFSTSLNGTDQYLAGYDPNLHSVVVWDEAGAADPRYVSDVVPQQFLAMCSGGSLPLNSAELSQKGRRFFRPKVFVVHSNKDTMGLDDYIRTKGAIYRRFSFAFRLTVKPEFKKDGGEGVDAIKVAEYCCLHGLSHYLETVNVVPLKPGSSGWVPYLEEGKFMTVKEATAFVHLKAQEHRNRKMVDTTVVDNIMEAHPCSCGLYMCDCNQLVPMAGSDRELTVHERINLGLQNLGAFLSIHAATLAATILFAVTMYTFPGLLVGSFFVYNVAQHGQTEQSHATRMSVLDSIKAYADAQFVAFVTHMGMLAVPGLRKEYFKRARVSAEKLAASRSCRAAITLTFFSGLAVLLSRTRSARKQDSELTPLSHKPSVAAPPLPFSGKRNIWRKPDVDFELGSSAGDPVTSVRDKLKANLWQVRLRHRHPEGHVDVENFHVLGIEQNFAFCPWHSVAHIPDGTELCLLKAGTSRPIIYMRIPLTSSHVRRVSHDIGLIELTGCPQFKNITRYLEQSVEYQWHPKRVGYMGFYSENAEEFHWDSIRTTYREVTYDTKSEKLCYHAHVCKLPREPYPGICGSFYLVKHNRRHSLSGMFVAGTVAQGVGAFAPITLKMYQDSKGLFTSQYPRLRALSSNAIEDSPTLSGLILQEPDKRSSHVAWLSPEELGCIKVLGHVPRPMMRPRSRVYELPLGRDILGTMEPDYTPSLAAPRLFGKVVDGIYMSPEKHALKDLSGNASFIDIRDLDAIVDFLSTKFSKLDFSADSVIDAYSAISGSAESTLVSSARKNTGAGYPFFCKKKELLVPCPSEQAPDGYKLGPECQQLVDDYIDCARRGIRYDVLGVTCPKDEPVKPEKARTARARIFTVGSFHYFVVSKMYLGTFLSLFSYHFLDTETVGGVNPFSNDWGAIYSKLCRHNRVVNGDFSRYDKKINGQLIMAVFDIILRVKRSARSVSREEEDVIRALATDVAFPHVLMGGDVLSLPGSLSSGVLMTFHVNNIANSIYIRLAYLIAYRRAHPGSTRLEALHHFEENVVFFALGDDNTFSISEEALQFFNFEVAREIFARIGINYTLADKSGDSYGSVDVSLATIGKRRFVPDVAGYVAAPIERPTIGKILLYALDEGPLSPMQKQLECIEAAATEMSQYPEAEYVRWLEGVQDVMRHHQLEVYDKPWEYHKQRQWNEKEDDLVPVLELEPLSSHPFQAFKRLKSNPEVNPAYERLEQGAPPKVQTIMDKSTPPPTSDAQDLVHNPVATVTETESSMTQQQTVAFSAADNVYTMDMEAERDETYNLGHSENVPLGDFLNRPISIPLPKRTWEAYTLFYETFDPWIEWQEDPRVRMKLSNFAYASFDLTVRFMLNSTPFHYGKLLIVYIPYGDLNQVARNVRDVIFADTPPRKALLLQYFSTYPHAFLTAGSNNQVEMKLPFVYHQNFFPLAGAANGLASCGEFLMVDINALAVANSTASLSVDITAFAWAENIKINTPTELVPLSGSYREADADGRVSTTATAVANAAGQLTRVPVIGPFATATEIVARSAGKIAALFGFSAPLMHERGKFFLHRASGPLAGVIGGDPSVSLSLDPEQAITVDPRTVGIRPVDEMTFSSIAQREQWICRTSWRSDVGVITTVGAESILFWSAVTPFQTRNVALGDAASNVVSQTTPAGQIAKCFKYWNGSVTYRVQVVASQYHSGRLLLQFDPMVTKEVLTISDTVTTDVNGRQSMVLDLADGNEVEFTINYKSYRPWLRVHSNSKNTMQPADTTNVTFSPTSLFDHREHMGIFIITVLNELVAPMPTNGPPSSTKAPVDVNIYVRAEDDLQFGEPTDLFSDELYLPKLVTMSGSSTEPASWDTVVLAEAEDSKQKTSVFFGETVTSIRSLIKRYALEEVLQGGGSSPGGTSNNGAFITSYYVPHFATAREHTDASLGHRTPFYNHFAPAFLIQRGGIRKKFVVNLLPTQSNTANIGGLMYSVERLSTVLTNQSVSATSLPVSRTTSVETVAGLIPHGPTGMDLIQGEAKNVVEVQSPYYNNTRFTLATQLTSVDSATNQMVINPSMDQALYLRTVISGQNTIFSSVYVYGAAADDYSLSFYLAPPPTYA